MKDHATSTDPPPGPGDVADDDSAWLDASFVAGCVGLRAEDVRDMRVTRAVAEGNNYCSTMFRVRADTPAGGPGVHLIVKSLPKAELMVSFVTQCGFFRRELDMLQNVMPAMQRLGAARCGSGSPLAAPLGPAVLPCDRPDTIVMQDLSVQGFRNAERRQQLDMQHCKVALSALARFHALSAAMHRGHPQSMDEFGEVLFLADNMESKQYVNTALTDFQEEIDTWEELKDTEYAEKLRAMLPDAYSRIVNEVARQKNRINVLNHGDFWINNFMFQYDGEDGVRPKDIRLVDLQVCRYSSPALDLQYFITTSPKEEVRLNRNRLDELLEHYRTEFNTNLSQLGLGDMSYSRDQLKEDFMSKLMFGFYTTVCILGLVVAEPSDRLRVEDYSKDEFATSSHMQGTWRGKTYRRLLPQLLKYYSDIGFFK